MKRTEESGRKKRFFRDDKDREDEWRLDGEEDET